MIEVAWSDGNHPYYVYASEANFKALKQQLDAKAPLGAFQSKTPQNDRVQAFMTHQSVTQPGGVLIAHWEAPALKAGYPIHDIVDCLRDWPPLASHHRVLATVLSEAFSNALEHGLLNLDSALKHSATGMVDYYQQREEALKQLTQGWIKLCLAWSDEQVHLTVDDSGAGFEERQTSKESAHQSLSGRGRQLLEGLGSLQYANGGSTLNWTADFKQL